MPFCEACGGPLDSVGVFAGTCSDCAPRPRCGQTLSSDLDKACGTCGGCWVRGIRYEAGPRRVGGR